MPINKSTSLSGYHLALYLTIKRAISSLPSFERDGDGIIQLNAPAGADAGDYETSLKRYLCASSSAGRDETGHLIINASDRPRIVLNNFDDILSGKRRGILIVGHGVEIPARISLAVDEVLDLRPISSLDFRIACRQKLGLRVGEGQAARALAYPPELLWAALRRGRPIENVLDRLSKARPDVATHDRKAAPDVPTLNLMHGYGLAKAWGLELAQDLRDWRDGKIDWSQVDRGIVLSGPPGVGKTIFARSLARECDVPIVAGSLGLWQSTGHLGDLLKAMRKDFGRARESAPAILFIDELDAFGDRNSFTHDHKDYSVQVVNAFLELLDGLEGREGVVVIGATNNLSRIDPAILRSGRLDRHVEIGLPNDEDRTAILHQQLNGDVAWAELSTLVHPTRGLTGADLAKLVRDARRIARREGREVVVADLRSSLPELIPITGQHRRSFAVHEAGHTVAILRLKHGVYQGTTITDHARNDASVEQGGAAFFRLPNIGYRDAKFYRDHIVINLAGIAAEEVILGSISDGAGSGRNSDLAVATRIATCMQTAMGMGNRLRHSLAREDDELEKLRHADPSVAKWVDGVLATEFARAKQLIREDETYVQLIADLLFEKGRVTPEAAAMLDPRNASEGARIDAA